MRKRGDAFYSSHFDPRSPLIKTNFDALAEIIKQCHSGAPRIQVHCWFVSHCDLDGFHWDYCRYPSLQCRHRTRPLDISRSVWSAVAGGERG